MGGHCRIRLYYRTVEVRPGSSYYASCLSHTVYMWSDGRGDVTVLAAGEQSRRRSTVKEGHYSHYYCYLLCGHTLSPERRGYCCQQPRHSVQHQCVYSYCAGHQRSMAGSPPRLMQRCMSTSTRPGRSRPRRLLRGPVVPFGFVSATVPGPAAGGERARASGCCTRTETDGGPCCTTRPLHRETAPRGRGRIRVRAPQLLRTVGMD